MKRPKPLRRVAAERTCRREPLGCYLVRLELQFGCERIVRLALRPGELALLQQAADLQGVPLPLFIRQALAEYLQNGDPR